MKLTVYNNTAEMINEMLEVEGSGVATLETTTTPKCTVKSRATKTPFAVDFPKGEISITKREYVQVGVDYENAVNNQRKREGTEGDFESSSLPWGEWAEGSHIVIGHKGKYYLRYYISMNANYRYSEKVYHYADGSELTAEEKANFQANYLPAKRDGKVKQGVDKAIEPRSVGADNITRLVYNKVVYVRNGFIAREENSTLAGWHERTAEVMARREVGEVA